MTRQSSGGQAGEGRVCPTSYDRGMCDAEQMVRTAALTSLLPVCHDTLLAVADCIAAFRAGRLPSPVEQQKDGEDETR